MRNRHGEMLVFGHKQDKVLSSVQEPLVGSLLLVAMPFAPSSVLAPSSKARSP